ncbi:MAG TPA: type IV secretion protein Rhs [Cyanobacteria bacterium UBA8803]|nr:type IV secretion protein Rhs [Cyanobacteria bacterium UBA9273]HBL58760.1 type IV secretion protein Rhs [Cyanobacteria bacterium UBA8803]
MNKFCDAFISYGRADSKAFATKLHTRLLEQGFQVWFDQNDIPLGVDFQNQIDDGIEKAHNFLFLIAPHSVNSPYCRKEIELALQRHKRIIPLLHVEQITQDTWQQRFPNGTTEEWEAYKHKGLHSSFPNMHPAIGKINWVYFREGIDDFETAFLGLINLLRSHTDYVEKHTQILAKALKWERHQKKTSYLLIGEERPQAEAWLKIHFKDEQPPCVPTDLHCEYITESIKNANNLMTQVFLSYADEDRETMEKIRNSLRRESITVWTNKTDIQTGEPFEEAINRGIEQADNLVFLLSPDSVKSTYCQQELDLALSLSKRIIPLLVRETDPNQVPSALRALQYINLTDNVKEDDYLLDESQLLKIFHQDAAYYNEHKILLTKALKWKRQNENPSILLRGYNLRSAETWLKVAKKRAQQPPTQLQEEFIEESLRQPPLSSLDVFISYSRADSDLARQMNDSLQMQGKTTWFDQESIASGSDFQQEIYRGIKVCDNFLFILSPRSVNSLYCKDEVEYAAQLNKRFVTVLHREVNPSDLHPELAKVQWIDFNQNDGDFNANFNQLVRTLDTDREHVQSHTKWLQRAIEWEQKGKSADLLLRGNEYVIAQNWLQEAEQKNKRPAPNPLQKEFLAESGNAIAAQLKKQKRQVIILRLQLALMSVAFIAAAGLGLWAFQQRNKAKIAEENAKKSLTDQVDALSRYSRSLASSEQNFEALIEGIRAGKQLFNNSDDTSKRRVEKALREALYDIKEFNRLGGQNTTVVKFSRDHKTIATADRDGKVTLLDFQGISKKPLSFPHQEKVADVELSPDGKLIATFSEEGNEGTGKLWQLEAQQLKPLLPNEKFNSVSFSPDGKLIATSNFAQDKITTKLWEFKGDRLNSFNSPLSQEKFDYLELTPERKIIYTINSAKETLKLWSLDGKELTFPALSSKQLWNFWVENTIEISSDGKMVTSFKDQKDKEVKLWHFDGKESNTLSHDAEVKGVWFSPNNQIIATASQDTRVKLWNQNGEPIATMPTHSAPVYDVTFSPDGNTIATTSYDKTVKLWDTKGNELQTLNPGIAVDEVSFSSDGQFIATLSEDKTVKLWQVASSDRQLVHHDAPVNIVRFSAEGKLITIYGDNQTTQLWSLEGKQPQPLLSKERFERVEFSLDGKLLASYSGEGDNQKAQLWSVADKQLKPLLSNEQFDRVEFSPNSKMIAIFSPNQDQTTIKLWNREQTNPIRFMTIAKEQFNRVKFSPDGKLIAIYIMSGDKQTVKIWNLEGKQPQPLPLKEQFDRVEFSPDGKLMAIFSKDEDKTAIELWQREGMNPVHFLSLNLPQEKFNELKFSPDGKLIATYSWYWHNRGRLWSMESKQTQSLLPQEQFNKVEFSPNGKLMATINSKDRTIKFWQRDKDGKPVQNPLWDKDVRANTVKFSSDSQLIATVDDTNTVRLWNQQGDELSMLNLNDSINDLSFSPDGKYVAIASNKTAILWHLARDKWRRFSAQELKELVNEACKRVGNYLQNKPDGSDRTLCDSIGSQTANSAP